ncbi:FUSC family protein [Rhodococcus sp. 27YEA15]|uniref:FUSC family protein n=1 Tax=Rhodococcus sp. 27YEA15 TaxID=3156259 RepID=UPI003C7AD752
MPASTQRFTFALSWQNIKYAVALVGSAALVLGGSYLLIGPHTAQAGYLAIMFLLSPARALQAQLRLAAGAFAVIVAVTGFLVGPLGTWAVLGGLVLVCLVQGMFRIGEVASMTRSPVNFVVFAGIGATGAQMWPVVAGSVIGAGFILLLAWLLPAQNAEPLPRASVRDRMHYGLTLAAGSVIVVVGAELIDFDFVSWALLSFCTILSVGFDNRFSRARNRILGTIAGALCATVVALTPAPLPVLAAVIATLLCVAYLRAGNYALFVTFLTPAVLLTTGSDHSPVELGIGRVEAVFASAAVALVCALVSDQLTRRHRALDAT